jgi:hypothetical protein
MPEEATNFAGAGLCGEPKVDRQDVGLGELQRVRFSGNKFATKMLAVPTGLGCSHWCGVTDRFGTPRLQTPCPDPAGCWSCPVAGHEG